MYANVCKSRQILSSGSSAGRCWLKLSPSPNFSSTNHPIMTRTKKCAQQGLPKKKKTKSTTSAAVADPTAETSQVVEAPTVSQTPEDLLLQAAHLIAACLYEEARVVSVQAVDLAVELEDATLLTDALEVLGTVELELGELEAAKEVSAFLFYL